MRWATEGPLPELPKDVHDWPGVAAVGLWVIAVIGGLLILSWHRNNYREQRYERIVDRAARADLKADTEALRNQVANGHAEPLRADVDRVLIDVGELKSDVRQMMAIVHALPDELRGLRKDIEAANAARRDLAADVRADMSEIRKRYGHAAG